jgi:hypothetical protein
MSDCPTCGGGLNFLERLMQGAASGHLQVRFIKEITHEFHSQHVQRFFPGNSVWLAPDVAQTMIDLGVAVLVE